jgi:hypothetical protein
MLSVSDLVNVTVTLSPQAVTGRSFSTLMIAGDSSVISGAQRFRTYSSITGVASDFGTTAPEYQAALLYFGQSPQPSTLMIGRWLSSATSAQNLGQILTASQQVLSNFTSITSGGFDITIDGSAKTLTGLNFSSDTNLNGVASTINGSLTGAVCSWNGTEFVITSNTTGAGTAATGTITFTGNPSASDTVTVNGLAITFESSSPSGNQVLIGPNPAATAANLLAFLQASSNADLTPATYALSGNVLTITYGTIGTAGNSFSLAKSSTVLSVSGSDLAGGVAASSVGYATSPASGSDISALLGLTASTSLALIPGYAAETPVQCVTALCNLSSAWYGLMFAATASISSSASLAVSSFIEAQSITRIHGVTTMDTSTLSSLSTTDLASQMMAESYTHSFIQFTSQTPYAVASFFGRAFTVNFSGSNTTLTMMYKQEPLVLAENLTETQAATLTAKRCNVFVQYVNGTSIVQNGVMSGPRWFDETFNCDWFQNDIQTDVYNALYTSTTKIPQTDAGVNQIVGVIANACNDAVNNGMAAPGIWNAAGFGSLSQGQYLKTGYYIYAQPIAQQSQSNRDARIAPPIQVAIKLAGAIQYVDVMVSVNQ